MKKIILAFILGMIISWWSYHNFFDIEIDGMPGCMTNSWMTVSEICVFGRNPFGKGPWTLWLEFKSPVMF